MNLWKALALVMICLLAIAVGLRFADIEEHGFTLNEKQKTFAINAAQNGLKDEIQGNNYNVTVQERGRTISTANGDKKVVRVVLSQGNVTLTALVDMDTGNVVEKSRVESRGWMVEYRNQKPRFWSHQRLFDR
jgi:ssDNA-binding replication factor A large subunit